jgi:hypothetical protein
MSDLPKNKTRTRILDAADGLARLVYAVHKPIIAAFAAARERIIEGTASSPGSRYAG